MTLNSERSAIESRFKTQMATLAAGIPIAWENVPFRPSASDTEFVEFFVIPTVENLRTISGAYRRHGLIQTNVYIKKDTATARYRKVVDAIASIFRNVTFDGIVCRNVRVLRLGDDEKWYKVVIDCPYYTDISSAETPTNLVPFPNPVANFSGTPTGGIAPFTVAFSNLSSFNNTSWLWTFGALGTSSLQNPSFSFGTPGTFDVKLLVTNADGATDSELKSNYIAARWPAPVADFSGAPTGGDSPLTVTFTNLSTGNITSYLWTFNGSTSSQENPTHVFTAGTHDVSLKVTGPGGSDTESKLEYVTAATPISIDFEIIQAGAAITAVEINTNFTVSGILISGTPATWQGDFNQLGIWDFTGQEFSHSVASTQTLDVAMRAFETGGVGTDTETKLNYLRVFEPVYEEWPITTNDASQWTENDPYNTGVSYGGSGYNIYDAAHFARQIPSTQARFADGTFAGTHTYRFVIWMGSSNFGAANRFGFCFSALTTHDSQDVLACWFRANRFTNQVWFGMDSFVGGSSTLVSQTKSGFSTGGGFFMYCELVITDADVVLTGHNNGSYAGAFYGSCNLGSKPANWDGTLKYLRQGDAGPGLTNKDTNGFQWRISSMVEWV